MYRSYLNDDDDFFPDSFFPWPVWFIIPCVIILILIICCVIGVIIKICCCGNSSTMLNPPVHAHAMESSHAATAPYYEPSGYGISHIPHSYPDVYINQINGKTHAVSNHTSQSHSVYHDLPPSYEAAVGLASAPPCTSNNSAGFASLDSDRGCTSRSAAGCSTHT